MQRTRNGFVAGCALAFGLALVACGGGGGDQVAEADQAEFAWLQQTKQQLDAKRQELRDLQEQLASQGDETPAAEEGEPGVEGESAEAEGESMADRVDALSTEVTTMAEEYGTRLVTLFNKNPMIEGEEPTERQQELLRMKSDEDILLAQEWIDRGGDYKRAIDIFETALTFDPNNEKLQQALATAEANRWMTEERFAQAKKGMTQDEVRSMLGQVNLRNVREFPERHVTAWFYPKNEEGAAAAVWFQPGKDDELRVYKLDFNAIEHPAEGADA